MLHSEAGISSPVRKAWVGKYGGEAVTHAAGPPSPRYWNDPLERHEPVHLVPVTSQELPERCCRQRRTALEAPTLDFSSGFTPKAFPVNGYAARQWRFEITVFPSLSLTQTNGKPQGNGTRNPEWGALTGY